MNDAHHDLVIVDTPARGVRRITLNRPEKRNALNHALRGAIVNALTAADQDPDVRAMILRGAGECFSAGYDLIGASAYGDDEADYPWFTPGGEGHWPRHVSQGWLGIWELQKPVIAQVHGFCLAGGSELATCCDLVYVAEDAQMGYPAVRFGVPDMHFHPWFLGMRKAMEMMLTGDAIDGKACVRLGWANECFPSETLDENVLRIAQRIATLPADLAQLNKRLVHRQMEIMGLLTGLRAGSELCALGMHQQSMQDFLQQVKRDGVKKALSDRDGSFGDYRTRKKR